MYRALGDGLYSTATAVEKAAFAAAQTADPDLRVAGQAALVVMDLLVNFNKPIFTRNTTPYGVRYKGSGEIDIETTKALVEVTTQSKANGKVAQLVRLLSAERNYFDGIVTVPHPNVPKPVLFYMPRLSNPASGSARRLRASGAHGVYNSLAALEAALRGL